jgi:ERCC4-type nuclease
VLFLVDGREKRDGRDRLCDRFSSANIPFEVRHLPIGDVTWVAQGRKRRGGGRDGADEMPGRPGGLPPRPEAAAAGKGRKKKDGGGDDDLVVELVLGTIIERKTLHDLESSIHGTRYAEQRMRLRDSGLSQLVLLVEGSLHRDATVSESSSRFLEKCHTAVWETCLYLGFQAVRTADLGETIAVLKLLHRRVLQRSFPSAFYDEALPSFAEPTAAGEHRGAASSSVREQQELAAEAGRRKRRRHQSLHKLVFDVDPTPPAGMDRLVTYQELKAKVECDRESGLRTARMVHGAMLKQVPKVENKKAAAIVGAYPTPSRLFEAYDLQPTDRDRELMLRDLDTAAASASAPAAADDPSKPASQRRATVGLEGSRQVYAAYAMTREASERPTCPDQARAVQRDQQQQPAQSAKQRLSLSSQSSSGGGDDASSSVLPSRSSSAAATTTSLPARAAAADPPSPREGPPARPEPPPIPPFKGAAAGPARGGGGPPALNDWAPSARAPKEPPDSARARSAAPSARRPAAAGPGPQERGGVIDLCGDSTGEEDEGADGARQQPAAARTGARLAAASSYGASAAACGGGAACGGPAAAASSQHWSRNHPRHSLGSVSTSSSSSSTWALPSPIHKRGATGGGAPGSRRADAAPAAKKPRAGGPVANREPEVYELLSD